MTNTPPTALPLADIQLQTAPGLWPLAWGWWLLIIASLAAVFLAVFFLRRRTQRARAKNEALDELIHSTSLAEVNALLKRAALSYFVRDDVAKLTGSAWLEFLDSQLPAANHSFVAHHVLWQKGAFAKEGLSDDELTQCKLLAEHWLKQALPPKAKRNMTHPHRATKGKEASHV